MAGKSTNLNNYIQVPESEATWKLTLFKSKDGSTPPVLFLKSKRARPDVSLEDIQENRVVWNETLNIDRKCQASDYKELVTWWFKNASTDKDFCKYIKQHYQDKGLRDVEGRLNAIENYLSVDAAFHVNTLGAWDKRATDVRAFTRRCLNKNLREQK